MYLTVFLLPQHKLEAALLALGQFQHALSELQAWLTHTHTTLDTQRPVSSDPKAIEIELAKHHVCPVITCRKCISVISFNFLKSTYAYIFPSQHSNLSSSFLPRFYVMMCCPIMPQWTLWTTLPLSCWSPLLAMRRATWGISSISSTRAGGVYCSKPRSDKNCWRPPCSRYCKEAEN